MMWMKECRGGGCGKLSLMSRSFQSHRSLIFGGKSGRAFIEKLYTQVLSNIKNIFLKKEKSVGFKPVESSSKTVDRH